jgi:hypothetical protein
VKPKQERAIVHCVHTPQCGKKGYLTRADAKKALRGHRGFGFDRHVRPYRCDDCGCWHLGHLPAAVRLGIVTAAEFNAAAAAR